MAFTTVDIATSQLLESTFISDMRLIVNANIALLKSQLEDIINELQIDVVNRYIGVDSPVARVYSNELILSSSMQLKSGTSGTAGVIASLTQSNGVSSFLSDNVVFTKNAQSTALGSKVATPTVVIGTTTGNEAVTFPTSGGAGVADRGLYVGDSTTPIKAGFYGEVNFYKQSVSQSINAARTIELTADTANYEYTYADLKLSRTDPQFTQLTLKLPASFAQANDTPIYLLLHDDFSTDDSRPLIGQTFTITVKALNTSTNTAVSAGSWPDFGNSGQGINIIPGYKQSTSSGAGEAVLGYINSGSWTNVPASGTSGIYAATSGVLAPKIWTQFYNPNSQSGTVAYPLCSTISVTKTAEDTLYSVYTVTGGSNYSIISV